VTPIPEVCAVDSRLPDRIGPVPNKLGADRGADDLTLLFAFLLGGREPDRRIL